MAKSLGGILLPDDMVWKNKKESFGILMSKDYTIGGNLILYQKSLKGGQPIILEASEEVCWLQEELVDSLITESNIIDNELELNWEGIIKKVVFNSDSAPSVSFTEVWDGSGEYYGTINLIVSRLQ